jgi:N-acetylglucosamine-6-phosphate deacetylase
MSLLLMVHGNAILETSVEESIYIFINQGKILELGSISNLPTHLKHVKRIEIPEEHTVVPGFIDVHIHGAAGADTMDGSTEALTTMADALPSEGTTSFLPTTITQKHENIDQALRIAAEYQIHNNDSGKAEVLGVHLEGPFINPKRKGAQPLEHIIDPSIELFKQWQELSDGTIRVVTVAPEMPNGMEFVHYLNNTGVIASIGHSDSIYGEMELAVNAGAKQVTHLFNGMRGIHHREPGVAGSSLLFKELMVELIADGIHVRPEMMKLVINAKGTDGIILITDAMRAKGLKDGIYDLGGQDVSVADGQAFLADGTLAGSILKMNDSLKNIISAAQIPLAIAVKMASANPAKQLNVYDRKGSITIGKDADITILSEEYEVILTLCRGKIAFKRGEQV